jgi:hypothetical protein
VIRVEREILHKKMLKCLFCKKKSIRSCNRLEAMCFGQWFESTERVFSNWETNLLLGRKDQVFRKIGSNIVLWIGFAETRFLKPAGTGPKILNKKKAIPTRVYLPFD